VYKIEIEVTGDKTSECSNIEEKPGDQERNQREVLESPFSYL
jgi:hypothetical protein